MKPFDANKIIPVIKDSEESDDKYHNLDYLKKVLEGNDMSELKKVQEVQGWSDEEIELYSQFSKLRKKAIDISSQGLKKREERGLVPNKEELSMGAFAEVIEPQARDAVMALRRKGYNSFESGFYDFDTQKIGFENNVLEEYSPSKELTDFLEKNKVELFIEVNSITLKFKEFKDIEELKNIWDEVEKDLPDLGEKVQDSRVMAAKMFREKYQDVVDNRENKRIDEHAQEILETLGLDFDDLENKDVLDLGAGDAELARAAKKKGIDIFSLDKNELKNNEEGLRFVLAMAGDSPFFDEKFDLVVSHAGPPTIVNNKKELENIIKDSKRILRKRGEFRFGPLGLNPELFSDDLFTKEEENNFTINEREERVKKESLRILKSIDSSIEENKSTKRGFYILRK